MHNGIYSDGDRANAQLEVDALLAEIDKIANNTAFNGVKVLDGSYNSEIRAGNTNPEVIPIAIQRMNTDSLGGVAITDAEEAAVDTSTTFVHSEAKSTMSAGEGQVQILKDRFGALKISSMQTKAEHMRWRRQRSVYSEFCWNSVTW